MKRGWGEPKRQSTLRAPPEQGDCASFSPSERRAWCSSHGSVCQIGLIRKVEEMQSQRRGDLQQTEKQREERHAESGRKNLER